jgi:hypothetical protein
MHAPAHLWAAAARLHVGVVAQAVAGQVVVMPAGHLQWGQQLKQQQPRRMQAQQRNHHLVPHLLHATCYALDIPLLRRSFAKTCLKHCM